MLARHFSSLANPLVPVQLSGAGPLLRVHKTHIKSNSKQEYLRMAFPLEVFLS